MAGAEKYNVYRDGAYLTTVTTPSHVDSAVKAGETHAYKVFALKALGGGLYTFSDPSDEVTVTV